MTQQIRFGIIGTNTITEQFLKAAMSLESFKLNAIYSRTEERSMVSSIFILTLNSF